MLVVLYFSSSLSVSVWCCLGIRLRCDTSLVIAVSALCCNFRLVPCSYCVWCSIEPKRQRVLSLLSDEHTIAYTLISFMFTFRQWTAHCPLYCCLVTSFSRALLCLLTMFLFFNTSSLPFTDRLKSSEGRTLVDVCGAVRYWSKNRFNFFCKGCPSICAVFRALTRGCMNLSASALPCGK
jgi:hypothetical protein